MNAGDRLDIQLHMRSRLWIGVTLALIGVAACLVFASNTSNAKVNNVAFDVSKPFQLDFGRGSGQSGLNTVSLALDGKTTMHRQRRSGGWEQASSTLQPTHIRSIAKSIEENGLTRLAKNYDGGRIDGTQWVIWIRQGTNQSATYFDNEFPKSIRRFSEDLDRTLKQAGYDQLTWTATDSRNHERELWDAIN